MNLPYGFRIVGALHGRRRLVTAAGALGGYVACDPRAEVHKEGYLSAFQFGDDFRTHLEATDSTKDFAGSCWSPWLWFDIDREDDLDAATKDARRLAAFLVERYRLDDDDFLAFFSGRKGYHLGLPTGLWTPDASTTFHLIARQFCEGLAEGAGLRIDQGVYDKVRAFRAPNSKHPKTGLHKRRLEFDELLHLKTEAICNIANEPLPFDLPTPTGANPIAAADWQEAMKAVERKKMAIAERKQVTSGAPGLNCQTLRFIREGADKGDRHRLLYSAARNLAEFGCRLDLGIALLTEAGLDSGLTPRDVRRQIECGLADGEKHG